MRLTIWDSFLPMIRLGKVFSKRPLHELIVITILFSYCINAWNNLNQNIKYQTSISVYELTRFLDQSIFLYIMFMILLYGLKLLTRMRVNLSHLIEHKFKHGFQDTLNPLCSCINLETESVEYFLLRCPFSMSPCQTYLIFI